MSGEQYVDKSQRSVFVGNIPYEATEEKLKEIFSEVGPVNSFKLVYDRENGKPKGYGFCEVFYHVYNCLNYLAFKPIISYLVQGYRVSTCCHEKPQWLRNRRPNVEGRQCLHGEEQNGNAKLNGTGTTNGNLKNKFYLF